MGYAGMPFAARMPIAGANRSNSPGEGVAIWFACDDPDALHARLVEHGTRIAFPPKDGPFGRHFAFQDPFGYTITAHAIPAS